jgi:PAS domain S-box-containing protein
MDGSAITASLPFMSLPTSLPPGTSGWPEVLAAITARSATLFVQDTDLRYEWVVNPQGVTMAEVLGRTDAQILGGSADGVRLETLKRQVLATGAPVRERFTLTVHEAPWTFDVVLCPRWDDGTASVTGLLGAAIDVASGPPAPESVGLLLLDQVGRIAFADRVAQQLTGRPNDALVGEPVESLLGAPTAGALATALDRLAADAPPWRLDGPYWRDGQERWLRLRVRAAHTGSGARVALLGLLEDITDAHRAEEYFTAALRGSRGVLMVHDADLRYEWIANPQLGFSPAEVLGRTDAELLGEAGAPLVAAKRQVLATGEPLATEVTLPGPEGVSHYDLHLAPVRDLDGRIIGVSGAAFDITDAAISQREADRLGRFVHAMPIGVWVADADGTHRYMNDTTARLVGLDSAALTAHGWFHLVHDDDRPRIEALWRELITTRAPTTLEARVRRPDGEERTLRARATFIESAAGEALTIVGTLEDVTDELRQAARLAHQQRLEAVGLLAGGVAHDFNNLLASIHGFTELAMLRLGAGHEAAEDLEQVLAASRRATALARRILDLSRQGKPAPAPVDLPDLVAETAKLMRPTMPAGVRLSGEVGPGPFRPVHVVPSELQRALVNLVSNAGYAMRDRAGQVTIQLARSPTPGRPMVDLVVRDEGTGMSPETLARATTLFFTTKPSGEGTGLGLAQAKSVAAEAGGQLLIASAPGAGTTVTLRLPQD